MYCETPQEGDLDTVTGRPLRCSSLKLACLAQQCNKNIAEDWQCYKCDFPIEYGIADQYFFCNCGRSPFSNYGFRCKDLAHRKAYEQPQYHVLLEALESLGPLDELNILVLGETGVGRTTFINAFVNYLFHNDLDDAINDEVLDWVVPCTFNVQHFHRSSPVPEIIQKTIAIDMDLDEADGSTGHSATQRTKVYPMTLGDTVIRLIDTPGIGDTGGIEKDKENMADILAMLSNFEELHGILILLRSNNSRLTVMFRFIIEELLTHLHRTL